ncbi:Udp-glycosyltransferase 73b4 [Thalictrum thalictroides]|uniref:Udp-glycosyltransferase 73b4 n=1 Tax=Thalictrum thalictroides TaxID=46969 RepID=A0A7J6VYW3_THATH|nr:Udp-glycosyltransferase 73b4 [Thalictrum thalictroides]
MASSQPHVVIFPYMAQGHTLPLLDLSKAFSGIGVKVTIITTPLNETSIQTYITKNHHIHLKVIPFPCVDDLPKGCENTSHLPSMDSLVPFLYATKGLQFHFQQVLQDMSNSDDEGLPLCVISDFFFGP